MPSQAPSTKIANDIDLGNGTLYFTTTPFASFAAAASATTWRKFGLLKQGLTIAQTASTIPFRSGFPKVKVAEFTDEVNVEISGEFLESSIENIADAVGIGRENIVYTVKASAPAATTVVTGSTKTVVNVTSATGYAVGDKIRVGTGGTAQIGVIKSISSNIFTLYEALSRDITPTAGLAVAKIDTATVSGGNSALGIYLGLKFTKTHVGNGGVRDFYFPKAKTDGSFNLGFTDNAGTNDGVGIAFKFSLFSDPDVENGQLYSWKETSA